VGGGLAGLSLGLALRRADVPVTVLEAGSYPRHRVCGEFIAGLDRETIDRLGLDAVLAGSRSHRTVAWYSARGRLRSQTLPEPALGLSRHRLDHRLAQQFVQAGGVLRENTRVDPNDCPPGRVFAHGRRTARSPWIGLKIHARHLQLHRDLELHLGDEGYVGLAGVEDGRVNICGLFRRRRLSAPGPALLLGYLEAVGLRDLATRLRQADLDGDAFCAVAGLSFARRYHRGPGVVIGDAGGMVPPFTGNGMAMAFQAAAGAADHLTDYARDVQSWEQAARNISRELDRRFRLRLASADWLHPYLLRPARQRWLSALARIGLPPMRPLYAALH
jgi:flavin-dependent dehydrogenase